jgi:Papain-like cysteine protease AvrRpt2
MKGIVFLVYAVITLCVGGCCRPEDIGTQIVPLRGQETPVWCWAASGEMVMDFLGTDVSQCDEANKRFGRNDCCNSPRTQCLREYGLARVRQVWLHFR